MSTMQQIKELLTHYRLSEHHADYCLESFTELRPAYHNEEHCFSTAITFHDLAASLEVPFEGIRHGFLAALYHDANHLMAADDNTNIAAAVAYLKSATFLEADLDFTALERLIGATLNTRTEFNTLVERLLHDADLLQTVKSDWHTNGIWQDRLSEELAIAVNFESSMAFVVSRLQVPASVDHLKNAFLRNFYGVR